MSAVYSFIATNFLTLFLAAAVLSSGLLLLARTKKTHWLLYFLIVFLPLETIVFRYFPTYYAAVKYLPEALLYLLFLFIWFKYIAARGRWWPVGPFNIWIAAFLAVSLISLGLNHYSPVVWLLGLRQLCRFALVFFLVLMAGYKKEIKRNILILGAVMMALEALLGIAQFFFGGALDKYLFFNEGVSLSSRARLVEIEQFWPAGSRAFATMGRYDRLGSFLALGLTAIFPWVYILKNQRQRIFYWTIFVFMAGGLLLTHSRASWLAALAGLAVMGLLIMKDKKIKKILIISAALLVVYLVVFALARGGVGHITDRPDQPLAGRVLEIVNWRAWRESYEGFGRVFFIVNTPLAVVSHAPLFGVGLGNYGGGVAAALANTRVYDRLRLPFGIQNTYGQIDNNWMSVWGESGTLGLLCWLMIFFFLFRTAVHQSGKAAAAGDRALARGLAGCAATVAVLGFFGPYFEFRALMFYFWLYAGIVVAYE